VELRGTKLTISDKLCCKGFLTGHTMWLGKECQKCKTAKIGGRSENKSVPIEEIRLGRTVN